MSKLVVGTYHCESPKNISIMRNGNWASSFLFRWALSQFQCGLRDGAGTFDLLQPTSISRFNIAQKRFFSIQDALWPVPRAHLDLHALFLHAFVFQVPRNALVKAACAHTSSPMSINVPKLTLIFCSTKSGLRKGMATRGCHVRCRMAFFFYSVNDGSCDCFFHCVPRKNSNISLALPTTLCLHSGILPLEAGIRLCFQRISNACALTVLESLDIYRQE